MTRAGWTRWSMISAALSLLAAGTLATRSFAADEYDAATKDAIKGVVAKQLDALSRGDAAGAEAFASPGIRDKFPDPAKFLDMVRTHYSALIHPRSTQFVGIESSPHGPLEKVSIVAEDGRVWSAIYSFEKVDGEWRISGCGLEEDKNQQAI